ncbi:hypothetical protein P3G55_19140 [Leptospira sp. 96542]|nr:hypothetical protein [Leptospira sp. 96542]
MRIRQFLKFNLFVGFIFTSFHSNVHSKSYVRDYFVPEPLYFDLVRNLGSKKGELETNVLSKFHPKHGAKHAAEVEYTFLDNHAIEVEFPMEGNKVTEAKLAYQATFGTTFNNRYMHGFQTISESSLSDEGHTLSALYLSAFKFNEKIGILIMNGYQNYSGMSYLSGRSLDGSYETFPNPAFKNKVRSDRYLFNANVFYDYSETWIYGIEINIRTNFKEEREYVVLPNIKYHLNQKTNIHFGFGLNKELEEKNLSPIFVMRAVVEM